MVKINVRFDPKLESIQSEFGKFPDNIAKFIQQAGSAAALEIEGQAKKFAPVDTGRLRASIGTSIGITNRLQAIVQTNVNYAAYVHEGTKPHFPPISALEGWASRHGVSARAVAKSIARKGTKAQPFMRRAVEVKEDDIAKAYEYYITKGLRYISGRL